MFNRFTSVVMAVALCALGTSVASAALVVNLQVPESSGTTTANSGTAGGVGTLGSGVSFVGDEAVNVTGQSLNFDGTANSRVSFAPITEFQSGYSRVTVAAWVKVPTLDGFDHMIQVSSAAGGLADGFVLALNNTVGGSEGRLSFSYKQSAGGVGFSSGLARITAGEWNHVAAVFDRVAGTLRLYINGVNEASKLDVLNQDIQGNASVVLGLNRLPGIDGSLFAGQLDDVRIYHNQALTDGEIAALAVIPEPATAMLIGLGSLLILRRP